MTEFDPITGRPTEAAKLEHHAKLVKLTEALKDCFDPEFHPAFGDGVVMANLAEMFVGMAASMNQELKGGSLPFDGYAPKEAIMDVTLKLRNDGVLVFQSYCGGTFPLSCVWQAEEGFDHLDLVLADPAYPEGNVTDEDGEPMTRFGEEN